MVVGGGSNQVQVDWDIVPIFLVERTEPSAPISFQGTGFTIAQNLLVTCWHCVSSPCSDNEQYAAVIEVQPGGFKAFFLTNIEQDTNGSDLATANVDLPRVWELTLASGSVLPADDVCTYGFPLTRHKKLPGGGGQFMLHPRYLRGYITWAFNYEHPQYGEVPSYELDMPTPEGLSGAPLIRVNTPEVIGVIYGTHDVATVEQFTSIDPETGEKEPEVQRLESFGLAHHIKTLRLLRGAATQGLPLEEYLLEEYLRGK